MYVRAQNGGFFGRGEWTDDYYRTKVKAINHHPVFIEVGISASYVLNRIAHASVVWIESVKVGDNLFIGGLGSDEDPNQWAENVTEITFKLWGQSSYTRCKWMIHYYAGV